MFTSEHHGPRGAFYLRPVQRRQTRAARGCSGTREEVGVGSSGQRGLRTEARPPSKSREVWGRGQSGLEVSAIHRRTPSHSR